MEGECEVAEPPVIKDTLDNLHKRQRSIMDKDQVTKQVIQHLRAKLECGNESSLSGADYEVVGSTAENLVTSQRDDYDILLILGPPYTPQYFKSVYEAHGRHYLNWNGSKWKGSKPRYVDSNHHLCPTPLRSLINSSVQKALERANISGLQVTKVMMWKQTVRTILKDQMAKTKYVVDIIPQIRGGKWSEIEGVEAFSSLSRGLQSAVTNLESVGKSAVLFSLFSAPGTNPLLFTTSYALMEREFFTKNESLRDIVLLAKMVLSGHRWKDKYGLKSAHIKRVVLANTTTLSDLSPWCGMQEVWSQVVRQLGEGSLDGFPDKRCDLLWHKTEEECEALARAVADVLATLHPAFIPNYL